MVSFSFIGLLVFLHMLPLSAYASDEQMQIVFLNAGKADAAIITTDSSTVVIDTGTNSQGKALIRELKRQNCEAVDLLIITHFDKDHVGGADKLIQEIPVRHVLVPAYESDSKQSRQFFDAVEEYSVPCERLDKNTAIDLGRMHMAIDVANEKNYGPDEENDFSLVASVTFGNCSFLFAGDAENPRLGELLMESIGHHDVLKVPHHGQSEKLSAAFFEAVSPYHAVITSDEKHPEDASVVRFLENSGTTVWLTRKGSVICSCDGTHLSFRQVQP